MYLARDREPYHLNFEKSFITVVQEIFGFAAIDPNDSQEQLSTETQRHDFNLLPHDGIWNVNDDVRAKSLICIARN